MNIALSCSRSGNRNRFVPYFNFSPKYAGKANAQTRAVAGTWDDAEGIDFFANVIRHEERHRLDLIALWGSTNPRIPEKDLDGDFIPDDKEATLIPGHRYDNTLRRTYDDEFRYGVGFSDIEDYALRREVAWDNGFADSEDWSNPGHQ